MKKIYVILSVLTLSLLTFNCEEYDPGVTPPSFLTFGKGSQQIEYVTESTVYPITVYADKVSNQDRTVNIVELTGNDATGVAYTTAEVGDFTLGSSSVVIAAGEMSASTTIAFNPALSLAASRYVTFSAQSSDEEFVLNKTTTRIKINYKRMCFSNTIIYDLTLDRYGSETSWEIKNSAGEVVQFGGPYDDASSNILQPQTPMQFTLPDGTYTFTINDAYGDGMSYTAGGVLYNGSYSIAKDCGAVLATGLGNSFTTSKSHTFSLP